MQIQRCQLDYSRVKVIIEFLIRAKLYGQSLILPLTFSHTLDLLITGVVQMALTETMSSADPTTSGVSGASSIAKAPFDHVEDSTADLILHTSDNVDFYVHRQLLSLASSVFKDMFKVGTHTQPQELAIVEIEEPSSTIDSLLRICYPVEEVKEPSLDKVGDVLKASIKYDMPKARARMRVELASYISTETLNVYALACSLELESEARQAADEWRRKFVTYNGKRQCDFCGTLGVSSQSQWGEATSLCCGRMRHRDDRRGIAFTFSRIVDDRTYQSALKKISAGQFHRLIRWVVSDVGDQSSLVSPSNNASSTPTDTPLLLSELHDEYAFMKSPLDSDIKIQSIDLINIPTHISVLTYASAHEMLARKELGEYGPVIHLEEDARTLATLLQLCYPFADFEVTSGGCSVFLVSRVRKAAEKYKMTNVARAAAYLMEEQIDDHPLDVFFLAKQYGWAQNAKAAATRCLSLKWKDIEGPDAYTKAMEYVSAEIFWELLKEWVNMEDSSVEYAPCVKAIKKGGRKGRL